MPRVAAAAALILALSGCLAPAPTPAAVDAVAPDDDGTVVTATRVEAVVHALDERGRIAAHVCTAPSQPCQGGVTSGGTPFGLGWERPTRDVADPAALFWRVNVRADWQSESLVTALRMTVYVTEPCGIACVKEREVAVAEDAVSPTIEGLELFLRPGETGVRIRLETVGYTQTSVGEAAVDYHLYGGVAGFRAAGEPVVIG